MEEKKVKKQLPEIDTYRPHNIEDDIDSIESQRRQMESKDKDRLERLNWSDDSINNHEFEAMKSPYFLFPKENKRIISNVSQLNKKLELDEFLFYEKNKKLDGIQSWKDRLDYRKGKKEAENVL